MFSDIWSQKLQNTKKNKKKLDRVHNNIENDHEITMVPNRSWILAQFGSLIWENWETNLQNIPSDFN